MTRSLYRTLLFFFGFFLLVGFFAWGTGQVHLFDWDEINFAEAAREMLLTGNYSRVQINFTPFIEKPPFFFWLQTLAMKTFGINEFAARLPNALCGAVTVAVLYRLGSRLFSRQFGALWSLIFAGSFLPHLYFKSGIIDPWFNLWMFLGASCVVFQVLEGRRLIWAVGAGVFSGLAVLTKGPVGALLVGIASVLFLGFEFLKTKQVPIRAIIVATFALVGTASAWYLLDYWQHGPGFLSDFLKYQVRLFSTQDAGHGGPIYYHFVVLLLGCFPASVLLFVPNDRELDRSRRAYSMMMWLLLTVVLVVFSLVKTKILHYSSLAYFPISYLAAVRLKALGSREFPRALLIPVFVVGFALALFVAALPILGLHPDWVLPYLKDEFSKASFLGAKPWSGWEVVPAVLFLSVLIWAMIRGRKNCQRLFVVLLSSTAALVLSFFVVHLPRIEKYSQGPAIEFFQEQIGKRALVNVYGFKSYAHLFYSERSEELAKKYREAAPETAVEIPVYWVSKVTRAHELEHRPGFLPLGRRGGYAFFVQSQQAARPR